MIIQNLQLIVKSLLVGGPDPDRPIWNLNQSFYSSFFVSKVNFAMFQP
jgi:hypothetical protein